MDHKTAISTFATERYTLDAMTSNERDAFEEHFVDCSVCSVDVREAAVDRKEEPDDELEDEPKVVLAAKPDRPLQFPWRWRQDYLLPIAATLIIGIGIGRMIVPSPPPIDFDRPTPSLSLLGDARAAAEQNVIQADVVGQLYTIIPSAENAAGYRAEVRRGGRVIQGWVISIEQAQEPVPLPLRPLLPGGYELVIESVDRGGKRSEITRYSFNAESEDRKRN